MKQPENIKIKVLYISVPVCETCGKTIVKNEPNFFLYQKFYHVRCGYYN